MTRLYAIASAILILAGLGAMFAGWNISIATGDAVAAAVRLDMIVTGGFIFAAGWAGVGVALRG